MHSTFPRRRRTGQARLRYAALMAFVLVLAPGLGHAQPIGASGPAGDGYERSGFWLRLGFGGAGLDLVCDGCRFDREWDLGGFFGIGGAVSEQVLVGIGSNGWTETEDFEVGAGLLSAQVSVYPSPSADIFLQAGGGLAYAGEVGEDLDVAPGVLGGAGIDFPVSDGLAVTLYGGFVWAWFPDDVDLNLIQVGLGITVP